MRVAIISSCFGLDFVAIRSRIVKLLEGRAAIVTGASQGIGLGAGIALGQAGAQVAFNYRERKGEAEAAVEAINSSGGHAILVPGDVARQQDVERIVAQTVSAFGRLDIAVSNAAYSDREPFYSADLDGFRRTVDVTMWGAFHLLHAATRQMMAQAAAGQPAGGSIVI